MKKEFIKNKNGSIDLPNMVLNGRPHRVRAYPIKPNLMRDFMKECVWIRNESEDLEDIYKVFCTWFLKRNYPCSERPKPMEEFKEDLLKTGKFLLVNHLDTGVIKIHGLHIDEDWRYKTFPWLFRSLW